MNKIFLFSIILTIISCNPLKQSSVESKNNAEISFYLQDVFAKGEAVNLKFNNKTESSIILLNPERISIEKKSNEKWEKVKVLYCPCGASCPPPPEKLEIKPSEKFVFSWDQNESWCGEYITKFVQKTEIKFAGFGKYRMRILYKHHNKNLVDFYKYFEIKE